MSRLPLPDIQRATLTETIRRALNSDTVEIAEWACQPLKPAFGSTTGGLYRCCGTGREDGKTVPWSLILKVMHPPLHAAAAKAGEEASAFNYWQREALAYQSGLLDDLPGGLVAPRCFGDEDSEAPGADGFLWLWLEDVRESISGRWPFSRYGLAARHLGVFNGAYLTGCPLPSFPWLTERWLRSWLSQFPRFIHLLQQESTWQNPLLRAAFRVPVANDLLRLWAERDRFLDALDRLPRTLCHFDAWRTNLFARASPEGQEQTVAIDWAFVGIGAVGEEINPLVWASLTFFEIEPEEARALDPIVFEEYLAGLREAGWQGDAGQVRFGYAASAALRYGMPLLWGVAAALDESSHASWEHQFGRPMREIMERMAAVTYLLLNLAEEARGLLPVTGE
jgi:hypothetical protein